jgi:MFS family permease
MNRPGSARHLLHSLAAALLPVNRPVPSRTEDEIASEVERNYRWNFVVNLLDGASYWFGLSFVSSTTIAPLFLSKLTSSPLPIGLVAVIANGAWFLPQLFTAGYVERRPRKKPIVVNLGFFLERLPMWLLVVAAMFATRSANLALILFLVGYAWHGLGAGVVATAWQDLIANCFPVKRRGRFFGTTSFVGAGMGAAGAVLSTWLLRTLTLPSSFVYTFVIAAVMLSLSWFFVALTREPVRPVEMPRASDRQFLARLPGILRRDGNFRRFLVARSLMALGGMGWGFVTLAAVQRWQVPDETVGIYTAAYLVGQTAGNLIFGFLADRFGHKLSLELGSATAVAAFGLAWLVPSPKWYILVFLLLGVTLSAQLVSGILVLLEFSEPQRRPTYVGLSNTVVGLVGVAAPLLGTWLAGVGYDWLFAASASVSVVAGVAMRWGVREPRWDATAIGLERE